MFGRRRKQNAEPPRPTVREPDLDVVTRIAQQHLPADLASRRLVLRRPAVRLEDVARSALGGVAFDDPRLDAFTWQCY